MAKDVENAPHAALIGYVWAVAGIGAATALFWLFRSDLDKGQVSLLYLPVVIVCAIRFGFGPAVVGALLSFLCWDFFFLPPFYTFQVAHPSDWLSLIVFLMAAVTTARLASQARREAQEARAREQDTQTLYQASRAVSAELDASRILPTLADQIVENCAAVRCVVLRQKLGTPPRLEIAAVQSEISLSKETEQQILRIAALSRNDDQVFGLVKTEHLWRRALQDSGEQLPDRESDFGVYVPLRFQDKPVGVLHVGPKRDGQPYTPPQEQLILTLANNAAIAITREVYAQEASQAAALREADVLKDELLSLVSHELRTPLATIKAVASGLLEPDAVWNEAERASALQSVDLEADRLAGLVNNLLDLSRLEGGAWKPHKDWCDLSEIIGTALRKLSAEESARIQIDAAPGIPMVMADYVQIELVIANLLQNAIKYSPSDTHVLIAVSASQRSNKTGIEQAGVRVVVRDFGEGILPDEQSSLFARFYRGQRHRSGTTHGIGLGLALCRAVIRAHKGEIWVVNAPPSESSGAIFSFFLPCNG